METIGKCSRCGRSYPTEELRLLPESDSYERAYFNHLSSGGPAPEPIDEDALKKKYGFDSTALLCEECLAIVTKRND